MTTMRRVAGVIVAGAWLLHAPASAAEFQGDESRIVAVISGEVTEEGDLRLRVESGPVVTKVLEIYSEPSHVPLVYAASLAFSESEEGLAWQAEWQEEPAVFAELMDPATQAFEDVVDRPDGDTGLEVWAWGKWRDGVEEERLVSDVELGKGDFQFFSAPEEPSDLFTHCCVLEEGIEECVVCSDALFTCVPVVACGQ